MAFNINSFRARGLSEGGARPSLFEVQFPTTPPGVNTNGQSDLSFLVQAASLPASIVDQVEVPYFGRRTKFSGERVFQDWTVTVLNDEDFAARDFFESWSNSINTLLGNITNAEAGVGATSVGGPLVGYKIDGTQVLQYGKAGDIIRAYAFYGMWPKTVSDIRLDWGQTNQIEVFEVQFALDYWLPASWDQDRPAEGTAPGEIGTAASYTGV